MTWMLLIVFFIGFWLGFLAACLFVAAGHADDEIAQIERCRRCQTTREAQAAHDGNVYWDSTQN